jgi:hypothetical protein
MRLIADQNNKHYKMSWIEEDLDNVLSNNISSDNLESVRNDVRLTSSQENIESIVNRSESHIDFGNGAQMSSTRRGEILSALEDSRFVSSMNQLSVASVNVPECKPSIEGEDIHRHSFEMWKELLIDSMALAGIQDEITKFTVFKVKAGERLLEVFRSTKSSLDAPDAVIYPFPVVPKVDTEVIKALQAET